MRALLRVLSVALMAFLVSACSVTEEIEFVTSDLRIVGTVTSANDSSPISAATVILGVGGHFGGAILDSAKTDEDGRYRLEAGYRRTVGSCGAWVQVLADGYHVPYGEGGAGYPLHFVKNCTEEIQTMDISLDPL